jgi:hypothetical protein
VNSSFDMVVEPLLLATMPFCADTGSPSAFLGSSSLGDSFVIVGVEPASLPLRVVLFVPELSPGNSTGFTAGLPSFDGLCLSALRLGNGGGAEVLITGRFGGGGAKIRCGTRGTDGETSFFSSNDPALGLGVESGFFGDCVTLDSAPEAIPHKLLIFERRRGGTGGVASLLLDSPLSDAEVGVTSSGTSSSHTLSMTLVRMKAHNVHVVRRRDKHQPDRQRG